MLIQIIIQANHSSSKYLPSDKISGSIADTLSGTALTESMPVVDSSLNQSVA